MGAVIKWVVVVDIIHDFIVVPSDSLLVSLITSNLVWHHFDFLLISKLFHFIMDILLHFAVVYVEEIISSLHGCKSLLLWVAKVEIAITIIEVFVLWVLKEHTSGEVALWAHDFLAD